MICENLPDTMLMFEEIDIYAINFLKGKRIILSVHDIISKEIKDYISVNINNQQIDQSDRKEMLIFYRLAILTVGILEQYFLVVNLFSRAVS